jgi:hypothetical protein
MNYRERQVVSVLPAIRTTILQELLNAARDKCAVQRLEGE